MGLAAPRANGVRPVGSQAPPSARFVLTRHVALLLLLLWAVATGVGLSIYSSDQRTAGAWGCEMSYMTPSYYRLEWEDNPAPRYSLYLYREAGFDRETPSGHPVIFMPGNAGSFMQVRSIASSASRQYYSDTGSGHWDRPLDFFATDYNEDLSALHSPTLQEQGLFLAAAIPRILREYDHLPASQRPTQVTLLGHSMGGIVARLAATGANLSSIDAIITMSTPHSQPPVAMEAAMQTVYNKINTPIAHKSDEKRPLLISICGGQSDGQIVSDACALPDSVITPDDGFAVFTTSIPGVWTGVEHQAMVWCHQVRWRVARALLDMSRQPSRGAKLEVATKWLLGPTHLNTLPSNAHDLETYKLDTDGLNKAIIVHFPGTTEDTIAEPPLSVRYCRADGFCEAAQPEVHVIPWLSDNGRPFPSAGEGSHPEEAAFVIDLNSAFVPAAWVELTAPRGATIITGLHGSVSPRGAWVSSKSQEPRTHIELSYTRHFLSSLAVWQLHAQLGQCSGPRPIVQYVARPVNALKYTTVESRLFPVRQGESIPLHSHISGSSFQSGDQHQSQIELHIYQQPECQVESVTLSLDVSATLAKAMLRWRVSVVVWIAAWLAVILSLQLEEFARTGTVQSFNFILQRGAPAAAVVLVGLLALQVVQAAGSALGFAAENLSLGFSNILNAPLTIIAALWSLGAAVVIHNILRCLVVISGRMLGKPKPSDMDGGYNRRAIMPRAAVSAALLLAVALFVPTGTALAALFIVQLALTSGTSFDDDQSRFNLLTTLLSLMLIVLPFNLPEVAVWGKNLWAHGGRMFREDHAVLPVLPVLALVLLSSFDTRISRSRPALVWAVRITQVAAAVAFALGPRRPYLLLPACSAVFAVSCWVLFNREAVVLSEK